MPPFCDLKGCRGDCRTGWVTGGTADEGRRQGATPPIKKSVESSRNNDRQEGGYFQLSTDSFTVASNRIFSRSEAQKPIIRKKISQFYALYVRFYVAISGIRRYITLLPIKMNRTNKPSGNTLHVQENLDVRYDSGCHPRRQWQGAFEFSLFLHESPQRVCRSRTAFRFLGQCHHRLRTGLQSHSEISGMEPDADCFSHQKKISERGALIQQLYSAECQNALHGVDTSFQIMGRGCPNGRTGLRNYPDTPKHD